MKKIYLMAAVMACATFSAQNVISFEAAEGYQPGTIKDQNGWDVTSDVDGNYLSNQVVSNEFATAGTFSFKNAYEAAYGAQMFPIIGGQKALDQALNFQDTTISFDVRVTESDASNFEFAGYGISAGQEFVPVFDIAFDYSGSIYAVSSADFDFEDTGAQWTANRWYNIMVKITPAEIQYYIDGTPLYTTANFSQVHIEGLNFLHDNYGGDAYIDNIKLNEANMAVASANKGKISVYPNPVKDILQVQLPAGEKVANISIYNFAGQKIADNASSAEMNVENLKAGAYIITVADTKGVSYSSKFVKQ